MNFNERLKAARKHAGLTQKGLVEKLGRKSDGNLLMSQANLAKMETNPRTQGSMYTALIAKACEVNSEWLTSGVGEMLFQDSSHFVQANAMGNGYRSEARQESPVFNNERDTLLLYYAGMSQEHKSHLLAMAQVWFQMDNPEFLPVIDVPSQPSTKARKKAGM